MVEKTLAIIKPDAVRGRNIGKIIDMIEKNGFSIKRMEKIKLSREKAEKFYAVHKEKSFFNELVDFMISGPVIIMVLEKENAVQDWRKLMGSTDSRIAEKGSIRELYGTDVCLNAVHGSDSFENAKKEIKLFFPDL